MIGPVSGSIDSAERGIPAARIEGVELPARSCPGRPPTGQYRYKETTAGSLPYIQIATGMPMMETVKR